MNWDDVRIFLAVARQGQILGAARLLKLNHATVARRLSALERSSGATLVLRGTTGCKLSDDGERFLRHAEAIESQMLAAIAATTGKSEPSGSVRIGAPDGFGVEFLAPRLHQLTDLHPNLIIELVPVPHSFSLSRREADIVVTFDRPVTGRLLARKLTDYKLGLYASTEYLQRFGIPKTPDELRRHRLIGYVDDLLFSPALDYTNEVLADWRPTLTISSILGQAEAVRAGAGIGILHRYMAHRTTLLVELLPECSFVRSYWMVMHEDARNTHRVTVVADFLAAAVRLEREIFI
jgi:DNA-binding transcriptional LysR family regulator